MTFLPIVDRELRVASRKRRTYWSRVVAGAAAISIVCAMFILAELEKGFLRQQLGSILFGIFKWLSFAFVCSTGAFLTSDCLSEEKREGTLGLLFLTDLRGYDVVFGKLLATSLRAAYGLLAAFPVIGLSFLLGGVTGGEFWRLVLLLCNTLFFSLTVGAFVSSISRDAQRAMNGTLALLALFIVLFPGVDWWIANWKPANFVPRLSLFSATFAFTETGSTRLGGFWACLGIVNGLAWLLLGFASVCAPKSWQEKASKPAPTIGAPVRRFGPAKTRTPLRQRLLAENPIRWLALREQWMSKLLRIVVGSGSGLYVLLLISSSDLQGAMTAGMAVVGMIVLAFVIWVASQASRFFLEARYNGALELVLATPVRVAQIVEGHWWALRRMFLFPVVILAGLQATNYALQIAMIVDSLTKATPPGTSISYGFVMERIIGGGLGLAGFVTGLFAVAWFGMWMGLTSRKTNLAVIKTLVFVQVFPWLALAFLRVMLMIGLFSSSWFRGASIPNWAPTAITGILGIGLDVFFMVLSRRKVLNGFRGFVAQPAGSTIRPSAPPSLPSAAEVVAPPVRVP